MTNKIIQYLDANRTFTININANNLVDIALKTLKSIKESIPNLSEPEVIFNTNEIEYLQLEFNWKNEEHNLDRSYRW